MDRLTEIIFDALAWDWYSRQEMNQLLSETEGTETNEKLEELIFSMVEDLDKDILYPSKVISKMKEII